MIHSYIETRAEKLLMEAGEFKVGVDVENCALFLEVKVKAVNLEDDVSGFLVFNGDVAHIGYNNTHSEHRHRFTIAHELGHYILHKKNTRVFIEKKQKADERIMFRNNSSSTGEYLMEREANSFAAALLMPKKLIEERIAKSNNGENPDELISDLARDFNVSPQAMRIRLTNLGIVDYDQLQYPD